jgi:hypothetical protein
MPPEVYIGDMNFKEYVNLNESAGDGEDAKKTLRRLPKRHSDLVRGYRIIFQPSNSLKGDDKHIGFIDEKDKTITVASPWNYGREYTLLHEVGHAVWKFLVSKEKREDWSRILAPVKAKNKKDLDQNDEEIFCMIYAQVHAKNKMKKFDHEELERFVSKI